MRARRAGGLAEEPPARSSPPVPTLMATDAGARAWASRCMGRGALSGERLPASAAAAGVAAGGRRGRFRADGAAPLACSDGFAATTAGAPVAAGSCTSASALKNRSHVITSAPADDKSGSGREVDHE